MTPRVVVCIVFPMDDTGTREHLHAGAVAALLALATSLDAQTTKSAIARELSMTPANLREYETGVRIGETVKVRARFAAWAGVDVPQVTCWCDMPITDHRPRCRSAIT